MTDEERETLTQLLRMQLAEQRSARRWKLFFRLAVLGLLAALVILLAFRPGGYMPRVHEEHAALVRLEGPIFSGAGPAGTSAARRVNEALREAFETDDARIVILEINTPGGSPVQSAYIADEILRQRNRHPGKPVYAVIADICASGGMYAAVAAGEVYADPASLIGSIGVVFDGFGFVEAIDKLGIERRLMTAGKNKAMLDPFLPEDPGHRAHLQEQLDQIHAQFIERVKQGRKGKIDESPELFDGLFWTGEQALGLGLIDGFGDVRHVAEELNDLEEIIEYKARGLWWETLAGDLSAGIAARLFQLFTRTSLH